MSTQSHILKRYRYSLLAGAVLGLTIAILTEHHILHPILSWPGTIAACFVAFNLPPSNFATTLTAIAFYLTATATYATATALLHHLLTRKPTARPPSSKT